MLSGPCESIVADGFVYSKSFKNAFESINPDLLVLQLKIPALGRLRMLSVRHQVILSWLVLGSRDGFELLAKFLKKDVNTYIFFFLLHIFLTGFLLVR